MQRIFVYGTLKAGFPNFGINGGTRVPGGFVTVRPHALWVVGSDHVPWMVDDAGCGVCVQGELYDVPDDAMPRMDDLEDIGRPGGYRRVRIDVQPLSDSGATQRVWVYLQDMAHLHGRPVHAGPLAVYTQDHARLYQPAPVGQAINNGDSPP